MFCLGHLKERKNLEDIVIKGWIMKKMDLKEIGLGERVAWVHLAEGSGKWRFPVHTVVKIRVPYSAGNLLTGWGTVSISRKGPTPCT